MLSPDDNIKRSKVAQWWSTRLLTDRLWVRAPPLEPFFCRSGGIGRRTGLKILRGKTRTGSIPVSGSFFGRHILYAQIAQLVEQRTENPRVTGSIPVLGTLCASGSVVEHRLAKARVASSNLVSRFFYTMRV